MFEYLPDNVPIEETTKKSIANCAFTKVKKTKQKKLIKTVTSLAASFAIVFCMLWIVGFENVASAAEKIFYFIPGFGIQSESEEQMLMLKKIAYGDNEQADGVLYHAKTVYGENTGIMLNFGVDYKFNSEHEEIYEGLNISVSVNGEKYSERPRWNMNIGSDELNAEGYLIEIPKELLSIGQKYTLEIESDYFGELDIPFKLVNAENAGNAQSASAKIGEITATAVKYKEKLNGEEYVVVDVFFDGPDNYDFNGIISLYDTIYFLNEDKSLARPKEQIGTSFYFNPKDIDENAILKVREVLITQNIEKPISFTVNVPKDKQSAPVDITVPFYFGEVVFDRIERDNQELILISNGAITDYKINGVFAGLRRVESFEGELLEEEKSISGYQGDNIYKYITEESDGKMELQAEYVSYNLGESFIFTFN